MPPVVCKPLHDGNIEITITGANAVLDPAGMSQLIVDMAAVAIRAGVPGLGLIYEGLAETFFQHATPIMLLEPRQLFDQ